MRPVLVLKNYSDDHPAYLQTWLQAQGMEWRMVDGQAGEALPRDLRAYSALALLGGPMSANDDLPWLREGERLILQGFDEGIPVIGHCLGGQMMAKALGAQVVASPAPEIGWQALEILDNPEATAWFGPPRRMHVMQWHYEAFELPKGATALATSDACLHQAFCIGPHLALQFHLEIDAAKAQAWSTEQSRQWSLAQRVHTTVQGPQGLRDATMDHLQAHQTLADRVYAQWLSRLKAD